MTHLCVTSLTGRECGGVTRTCATREIKENIYRNLSCKFARERPSCEAERETSVATGDLLRRQIFQSGRNRNGCKACGPYRFAIVNVTRVQGRVWLGVAK